MFLRCCNTCQRDRVGREIETALPFLDSRKLLSIITALKTLPIIVMGLVLTLMSRSDYFRDKRSFVYLVLVPIVITSGFNMFNIYRFERQDDKYDYMILNARFSQYISIFFVDIVLIAVFMLTLILLRHAELEVLVKLGVYKNVENMSDKEMFSEYDKLKKQSLKLQKRMRKAERNRGGRKKKTSSSSNSDMRLSLNQDDNESDTQSVRGEGDSEIVMNVQTQASKIRDSLASQ